MLFNLSEKRYYTRLDTHLPLKFQLLDGRRLFATITGNISAGGVQLVTNQFIPLYSKLKAEFQLSALQESIVALGRVVWIRKMRYDEQYSVGIQFTEIAERTRSRVTEFVGSRASRMQPLFSVN